MKPLVQFALMLLPLVGSGTTRNAFGNGGIDGIVETMAAPAISGTRSGWVGFAGVVKAVDSKVGEVSIHHPVHCYPTPAYHRSVVRVELVKERGIAVCTYRIGKLTAITIGGKPAALADVPSGKGVEIRFGVGRDASNEPKSLTVK